MFECVLGQAETMEAMSLSQLVAYAINDLTKTRHRDS